MNRLSTLLKIGLWFFMIAASGHAAAEQATFESGVAAFNSSDFTKAREIFLQTAKQPELEFPSTMNLALVELKQGQKGLALAYLRKLIVLNPADSKLNETVKYAEKEMKLRVLSSKESNWLTTLELTLIRTTTLSKWLSVVWILLISSFFLALRHMHKSQIAKKAELPPPGTPFVTYLLLLFLLLSVILTSWKAIDNFTVRGTVIVGKLPVLSGPNASELNLFELADGDEVKLLKRHQGWYQIQASDGKAGWVEAGKGLLFY